MKPNTDNLADLTRQIAESEAKLEKLDWEIEEIGQPAAHDLKRRLDALKIESSALNRNLAETLGMENPGPERMAKVEALLHYIQSEEASVEHAANFLHQSGHTSAEFAAQAGQQILGLCLRGLKRVVGNHHPLGMSVFVNHSHENLEDIYGLDRPKADE
jgi:chromosome segregation ATPase